MGVRTRFCPNHRVIMLDGKPCENCPAHKLAESGGLIDATLETVTIMARILPWVSMISVI